MPPIGGPPYIDKDGGIIPYYEVFDTDNNRLDFENFVSTHFKEHLKFLYRMYGLLRIKTRDDKVFYILHFNDIDKLIIENGELRCKQ